jgi:hypothetical protein
MTGRPTTYTPAIAQEICNKLADGVPLAEICRGDDMPHPSTVWRWAKTNEALSQAIAAAREDGEERITADIRRTARGDEGYSTGDVQRDKLIIDTDLKLLAKWNPKKYGEKLQQEITGKDGAPLIPVTKEQRDAAVAAALAADS